MALVSDAGLPAISDPGARLIRACLEAGVAVTVLPGPSAVETALVASGLAGDRYQFLGFLPRSRTQLRRLCEELVAWPHPVVAFESAQRLPAALAVLADVQPDRRLAVCRELTKQFEEVARGTAAELADRFREPPRGEITLVLGAAQPEVGDEETARAAVAELVGEGVSRKRAAEVVARLTGVPRNVLYRTSL